jgi:hypothetical protein
MTFSKPRFSKQYDWELVRFASIGSFSITGGASKLLKHFKNNHRGSIVTYADKRYSDGNLYSSIGFKYEHDSKPNYFWTKGQNRFSRHLFQKHKLKGILNKFDQDKSESENMMDNDYYRVWDCGNMVFSML